MVKTAKFNYKKKFKVFDYKKVEKCLEHYFITRASRLELEIWSLKLPILPIKLYSFYYTLLLYSFYYY